MKTDEAFRCGLRVEETNNRASFLPYVSRLLSRESRAVASATIATALVLAGMSRCVAADCAPPRSVPTLGIPWEKLQVGPKHMNPVREVRVTLYDAILQDQPRNDSKPPICDKLYTREDHETTILRFEFALAQAIRLGAPSGPAHPTGGYELGALRVTTECGTFVVTVTNIGYALDWGRFPKQPDGRREFGVNDAFFSPLLTHEIDASLQLEHLRLAHHLYEILSGQAHMKEHDKFFFRNPDPQPGVLFGR